jgi:AcrR family transcriptional regulator
MNLVEECSTPMGRDNQKRRTRRTLVETAGRLIAAGKRPSVAEVAEAAEVSVRTAYRYFPSVEQLTVEATLEATRQNMELSIEAGPPEEPVTARVGRLVDALAQMTRDNESLLRQMIKFTVDRDPVEPGVPPRPARRLEYVERALAPLRGRLDPDELDRLTFALTVVMGIESVLVLRDICGLDPTGTLAVQRWAAHALVTAAVPG